MTCTVEGEFVIETDDAMLLKHEGLDDPQWWPFSQIDRIDWNKDRTCVVIRVPDWLAVKKGVL